MINAPTHRTNRTEQGVRNKVDIEIGKGVTLGRLKLMFNSYENRTAQVYIQSLRRSGRVTESKVRTGKRGPLSTYLTWA